MTEIRYVDGLRRAIEQEMESDGSVIVLGEDVAVGGPFGVTAGLADRFGANRVINTPISEDSIMGVATGAAIAGKRPIVEIMFIDFVTLAMSQLVNHAAKLRYMSGGQLRVPMVVRLQQGAVGGWGAHHSQSLEAWFQHVPGLKMVAPSNAGDALGLLRAAIRDDDPVLFLEHRGLYFRRDEVADLEAVPTLVDAKVVSPGDDLTIVTYSRMVWEAVAAAERLAERGVSAEVIDLRSLSPPDMETITRSVERTSRALVVHEAVLHGGLGAEIAARIQETAFDWLDAPVERLGAPFAPVPASPVLEAGVRAQCRSDRRARGADARSATRSARARAFGRSSLIHQPARRRRTSSRRRRPRSSRRREASASADGCTAADLLVSKPDASAPPVRSARRRPMRAPAVGASSAANAVHNREHLCYRKRWGAPPGNGCDL